jgi:hypothetical protein
MLASAMFSLGAVGTLATAPRVLAADPNEFSCRASVLNVQGKGPLASLHVEPLVANGPNDPCRTAAGTGLSVPLPTGTGDHVNVLRASTTDNESFTGFSSATASSQVVDAQVGGSLLHAEVLTAGTQGSDPDGLCGPERPTFSGDSHVAKVTLNGTVIEVPTAKSDPAHPTLEVPGLVKLFLREEIAGDGSITERALELQTPVLDVVISEAQTGTGANPNTAPCAPPGGCTGPETDPFVDPTAEGTAGMHPDCAPEFSEPKGDGDNTARDYVHFTRSINDTEVSPNGAFVPTTDDESRNRFYGDAGFEHDGDTAPQLEGAFYDDEDMHFRLAPVSLDAYLAPNDLAKSPWRRFCGVGVVEPFGGGSDIDMTPPSAPFAAGQMRKFMVEAFDAKWLNEEASGGNQSDYFVIDIYKSGSNFDTTKCDPAKGDHDHGESSNPNRADLDYHSEGQTIEGNIEIHSGRVADDPEMSTTTTTMEDDSNS